MTYTGSNGASNHYPNSYGGGTRSDYQFVEEESEELTTQLRSKVRTLKSLTIDIGEEVRNQNKTLSGMDDDMTKSGSLLDRTVRRLGAMSRGLHNYHTLILFAFVFVVFLLLWLALKFR